MATANIKAVITAEDRASGTIGGFGDKIHHAGRIAAAALAGVGAAAIAGGVLSIKAFAQQEDAMGRLQAGINNVRSAQDKSIASLTQQASALQRVTRFADEQIISGQAMLTTFQLNQKTIEKLTPSMLNMAEAMRRSTGETIELEQIGLLMGKVMGNAEGGVDGLATALRRMGVIMTDTQKDIFSTGTEAQRAATLVEIMDQNFAGFAEAGGKTFSGRLEIMKNQFGEMKEAIGGILATALTPFIEKLGAFAEQQGPLVAEKLTEIINKFVEWGRFIAEFLGPKIGELINNLKIFWHEVIEPMIPVIGTVLVAAIATVIDTLNAWIPILTQHKELIWVLIGAWVAWKTAMAISGVVQAASAALGVLDAAIMGTTGKVGGLSSAIKLLPLAISIGVALIGYEIVRAQLAQLQRDLEGFERSINDRNINKYLEVANRIRAERGEEAYRRFISEQAKQHGGPVQANRPYLVGEVGPELFVPSQSGKIVPNDKLQGSRGGAGGTTNINVTFSGVFTANEMEMRRLAERVFRAKADAASKYGMTLNEAVARV